MALLLGARVDPSLRSMSMGVSRCSIWLFLRFFPGVKMAVRRSLRALLAALAWGVGALLWAPRGPLEAEVPRRTELRRSRDTERSRGVWTAERGVRDGVLPATLELVGVLAMMAAGRGAFAWWGCLTCDAQKKLGAFTVGETEDGV